MNDAISSGFQSVKNAFTTFNSSIQMREAVKTLKETAVNGPMRPVVEQSKEGLKVGGRVIENLPSVKVGILLLEVVFKTGKVLLDPKCKEKAQLLLTLSGFKERLSRIFEGKITLPSNQTNVSSPTKSKSGLDPTAFARMEKLTAGSDVSKKELETYIASGKEISEKLSEGSPLTAEQNSRAGARDVIWYMMFMSATQGKEHTNGMFRIDDKNKALFNFINTCDKSPGSYGRISTHFNAHAEHTASLVGHKQRGLDMGDLKLPTDKHTILFSTLPDGTTFVKLEEYGFPPFWTKGFMNCESVFQALGHTFNFLKHLTGMKIESDYVPRRENIRESDRELFQTTLSNLSEMYAKLEKLGNLNSDNQKGKIGNRAQKGAKFGVTQMHRSLSKQIQDLETQIETAKANKSDTRDIEEKLSELKESLSPLQMRINEDKANGYEGNRQGDEVCLPSFSKFKQMSAP